MFEEVKKTIYSHDLDGLEGHLAVQINITGEGEGIFYIELLNGKVYVEPYEYYDRDCIFIVSAADFMSICNGELDSVKAFTTGKLKVQGSIDKALQFQKIADRVQKTPAKKPEKKAEKAEKTEKTDMAAKSTKSEKADTVSEKTTANVKTSGKN